MADGEWTQRELDREFASIWRQINSLPDRVKGIEGKLDNVAESTEDCNNEIKEMHKEFRASKQGLTRGEKIALLGSSAGFVGALVAAVALLSGGAG